MKKTPTAIKEQACYISLTGNTVIIECDERKDAEELFDFLTELNEEPYNVS